MTDSPPCRSARIAVAPHTRTHAQQLGDAAEDAVAARLGAAGWTILARRLHVGRPEIDLLAVDPGPPAALVVVEVRWRLRRDFGLAEESVGHLKIGRLRLALGRLLESGRLPDGTTLPALPARIDLVVVEPTGTRHHRGIG